MYYTIMDSPVDPLLLVSDGQHLTGLYLDAEKHLQGLKNDWVKNSQVFRDVVAQLNDYFAGDLQDFDVAIRASGTAFQQTVWKALASIPYGETVSYKCIAENIDSPKAVRAVGLANGKNPISIIVPCHRVIGANGKLTGYGGGLPRKQWLLAHEASPGKLLAM